MKISVKNLRRETCTVDVQEDTKISEVKRIVQEQMRVPVSLQTLVFNGRVLHDDKTIGFYPQIKEGTKLYMALRKPEPLDVALKRFLCQYYNEEQTKQIIDYFMIDFYEQVSNLSLEDLERIAISDLHNNI